MLTRKITLWEMVIILCGFITVSDPFHIIQNYSVHSSLKSFYQSNIKAPSSWAQLIYQSWISSDYQEKCVWARAPHWLHSLLPSSRWVLCIHMNRMMHILVNRWQSQTERGEKISQLITSENDWSWPRAGSIRQQIGLKPIEFCLGCRASDPSYNAFPTTLGLCFVGSTENTTPSSNTMNICFIFTLSSAKHCNWRHWRIINNNVMQNNKQDLWHLQLRRKESSLNLAPLPH